MSRTANLRRQHDAACQLVGQIEAQITTAGDTPSVTAAYAISMLLAKLTGILRIHFAAEDRLLYPSLMASGRGGVAAVARRFYEEMGQIGPIYAAYVETWGTSGAILEDWVRFRTETAGLFAALADRITRENEELYPLADGLSIEETPIRAA